MATTLIYECPDTGFAVVEQTPTTGYKKHAVFYLMRPEHLANALRHDPVWPCIAYTKKRGQPQTWLRSKLKYKAKRAREVAAKRQQEADSAKYLADKWRDIVATLP